MELKRIELAAVRPDPRNPRSDFGDIGALAASFEMNPVSPGEPLQPIVTVQDANVYRIVDGERRYRAMRELGTQTCWSNVCETMDEANSVVQMLATDDKQALTEEERSRGVQQMLILGVPEATVERTARIEGASRIKRVLAGASEPKPMTIDWMLAIADAQDAGDAEAAEKIAGAKGSTWMQVARDCERERTARANCEALAELARAAGFAILDSKPEDGELGQRLWLGDTDAEGLGDAFARGYRHLLVTPSDWGSVAHATAWMDQGCEEDEPEEDPEQEAARRQREKVSELLLQMDEDWHRWLGAELSRGNVPAAVASWFDERFPESSLNEGLEGFERDAGVELVAEGSHPVPLVAIMLQNGRPDGWAVELVAGRGDEVQGWMLHRLREWLGFYQMLEDAGWGMPAAAKALRTTAQEALGEYEKRKEEEKEDGR